VTVSLWFKLNPTVASSSYHDILSSSTESIGVQLYFNADKLYGKIRNGSIQWTAVLPVRKGVWHQVAMSWSASEGLYMMLDYNSHITGTTIAYIRATDDKTLLMLGALNNMIHGSADASVSR